MPEFNENLDNNLSVLLLRLSLLVDDDIDHVPVLAALTLDLLLQLLVHLFTAHHVLQTQHPALPPPAPPPPPPSLPPP